MSPLMSSLQFLTHEQLHEVLFDFLPLTDLLNYRCIHSACHDMLSVYSKAQVQDVIGQDLSASLEAEYREVEIQPRTVDACLVQLLLGCGEGICQVLLASPGGVRSLSTSILRGTSKAKASAISTLCSSFTGELVQDLVHVDLSAVAETSSTAAFLKLVGEHASHLRSLNVGGPRSANDDAIAVAASNCPELQVLDISYNSTSDHCFGLVATGCRQLRCINVFGTNAITDKSICLIAANCPSLRSLNVGATFGNITDASIKLVAGQCVELEQLVVRHSPIADASISLVAMNCRKLRSLDVSNTRGVTDESLKRIATNCRELTHLDVSHTNGITDASISLIAANCPRLCKLMVNETLDGITDASIALIGKNCHKLRSIDVSGWMRECITDDSIKVIARNCRELEFLDVHRCLRITDESLMLVAANCHMLKFLSVGETKGNITDISLKLVAMNCPRLEWLDVYGTNGQITDASISLVATNCRQLQVLDIGETEGKITSTSLSVLRPGCRVETEVPDLI